MLDVLRISRASQQWVWLQFAVPMADAETSHDDGQRRCSSSRFRNAGVEFIDENGGGPGVRLGKRQRPKKPK